MTFLDCEVKISSRDIETELFTDAHLLFFGFVMPSETHNQ